MAKHPLWTTETIWHLVRNTISYPKEFKTFVDGAKRWKDRASLDLVAVIRSGGDAASHLPRQVFKNKRWQRFLRRYADLLVAPIDPTLDFHPSMERLILTSLPVRRIPFLQAPALIHGVFGLGEPDLSTDLAIAREIRYFKSLLAFREDMPEPDRESAEARIARAETALRERSTGPGPKSKRNRSLSAGPVPLDFLLPVCFLVDRRLPKAEIRKQLLAHVDRAFDELDGREDTLLAAEYIDNRVPLGAEVYRLSEREGKHTNQIIKWIEAHPAYAQSLSHVPQTKRKFVENLLYYIKGIMPYFER